MLNSIPKISISLLIAVVLGNSHSLVAQSETINFNRDIRPILSSKCFQCHGHDAKSRKGDLRLDHREGAIDSGVIVPEKPDESSLLERVISEDPAEKMPPKGDALTKADIVKLRAWIQQGAKYEKHWAYIKPVSPQQPAVNNKSWVANGIDSFILHKMEKAGFTPSPQAEPAVLLRRIYLDLTGLPPSVETVLAFEADPSRKNYEEQVDRLLKSKHFGEKWAVHWLDLARYADSNGYQHDDIRNIWPYRDWVVQALNNDMPFDQFTVEQLAGDLLPRPKTSQLVATGFHRNSATNFSGGAKVKEVRANVLHDRVSTTGTVWLGMTLECAQCHDHKFDPVTQQEYYQLYSFFNQASPEFKKKGKMMFKKIFVGREVTQYASKTDEKRAGEIRKLIAKEEKELEPKKTVARADQSAWEHRFVKEKRAATIRWERFPYNLRNGDRYLRKPVAERTEDEKQLVDILLIYNHKITQPHINKIYLLNTELKRIAPKSMVMQDAKIPTETHIFLRGDYTSLGKSVQSGVPKILHSFNHKLPNNRLGLAKWLVNPDNPLTARVTVNRLWAEIFGQGIVATPGDFGMRGELPTHPELLDWLVIQFIKNHWSVKKLIKTIVMSNTYQQTSQASIASVSKDPKNQWYARGSRFRLPAELVRDNLLAISGMLSRKIGGPPVYPVQPQGMWMEIAGATETVYPTSTGDDRYRRGLYTIWRRGNLYPSLVTFDATNRSKCQVKRDRSNTPLQALTLLNDPVYVEMAENFASIIEKWKGTNREKIIRAFRRTLSRKPTENEVRILLATYNKRKAWFEVAQVLLNLDETISKS